jgi:hypothetical protein
MSRALVIVSLLVSAPAFAQDEPPAQEPAPQTPPETTPPPGPLMPPAPAYGSTSSQPLNVTAAGMFGMQAGGNLLSCNFCRDTQFGGAFAARIGAHITLGPLVVLDPEAMIPFSYTSVQGSGIIFVGILFGTRIGFQLQNIATPYLGFHFGYIRGQGTDCTGSNCGDNAFGVEVGAGCDFWLSPKFALGPFFDFNFASFQGITFTQISFGPSLTSIY